MLCSNNWLNFEFSSLKMLDTLYFIAFKISKIWIFNFLISKHVNMENIFKFSLYYCKFLQYNGGYKMILSQNFMFHDFLIHLMQ